MEPQTTTILMWGIMMATQSGRVARASPALYPLKNLGSHSLHVDPLGQISSHASHLGPVGYDHLMNKVGPLGHLGSLTHHGAGGSFTHIGTHGSGVRLKERAIDDEEDVQIYPDDFSGDPRYNQGPPPPDQQPRYNQGPPPPDQQPRYNPDDLGQYMDPIPIYTYVLPLEPNPSDEPLQSMTQYRIQKRMTVQDPDASPYGPYKSLLPYGLQKSLIPSYQQTPPYGLYGPSSYQTPILPFIPHGYKPLIPSQLLQKPYILYGPQEPIPYFPKTTSSPYDPYKYWTPYLSKPSLQPYGPYKSSTPYLRQRSTIPYGYYNPFIPYWPKKSTFPYYRSYLPRMPLIPNLSEESTIPYSFQKRMADLESLKHDEDTFLPFEDPNNEKPIIDKYLNPFVPKMPFETHSLPRTFGYLPSPRHHLIPRIPLLPIIPPLPLLPLILRKPLIPILKPLPILPHLVKPLHRHIRLKRYLPKNYEFEQGGATEAQNQLYQIEEGTDDINRKKTKSVRKSRDCEAIKQISKEAEDDDSQDSDDSDDSDGKEERKQETRTTYLDQLLEKKRQKERSQILGETERRNQAARNGVLMKCKKAKAAKKRNESKDSSDSESEEILRSAQNITGEIISGNETKNIDDDSQDSDDSDEKEERNQETRTTYLDQLLEKKRQKEQSQILGETGRRNQAARNGVLMKCKKAKTADKGNESKDSSESESEEILGSAQNTTGEISGNETKNIDERDATLEGEITENPNENLENVQNVAGSITENEGKTIEEGNAVVGVETTEHPEVKEIVQNVQKITGEIIANNASGNVENTEVMEEGSSKSFGPFTTTEKPHALELSAHLSPPPHPTQTHFNPQPPHTEIQFVGLPNFPPPHPSQSHLIPQPPHPDTHFVGVPNIPPPHPFIPQPPHPETHFVGVPNIPFPHPITPQPPHPETHFEGVPNIPPPYPGNTPPQTYNPPNYEHYPYVYVPNADVFVNQGAYRHHFEPTNENGNPLPLKAARSAYDPLVQFTQGYNEAYPHPHSIHFPYQFTKPLLVPYTGDYLNVPSYQNPNDYHYPHPNSVATQYSTPMYGVFPQYRARGTEKRPMLESELEHIQPKSDFYGAMGVPNYGENSFGPVSYPLHHAPNFGHNPSNYLQNHIPQHSHNNGIPNYRPPIPNYEQPVKRPQYTPNQYQEKPYGKPNTPQTSYPPVTYEENNKPSEPPKPEQVSPEKLLSELHKTYQENLEAIHKLTAERLKTLKELLLKKPPTLPLVTDANNLATEYGSDDGEEVSHVQSVDQDKGTQGYNSYQEQKQPFWTGTSGYPAGYGGPEQGYGGGVTDLRGLQSMDGLGKVYNQAHKNSYYI